MRRSRVVLLAALIVVMTALAQFSCWGDVTPRTIYPWGVDFYSGHWCNCACYCFTAALPITHANSPGAGLNGLMAGIGGGFVGNPAAGNLNGDLWIDQYQAYTCKELVGHSYPFTEVPNIHCRHGVELVMDYQPAAGEPARADLRFVQRFRAFGFGCGDVGPDDVIDNLGAATPYYPNWDSQFPNWPTRKWFVDAPESGCTGHCGQQGNCPFPCLWTSMISTYVANATPGGPANSIDIHDGINWGLVAGCAPGPNPRRAAPANGAQPGTTLNFDPLTGLLTFNDASIDVLNLDGSNLMDGAFAGDPLLGATISVDPFTLLGGGDGVYVFQGGKYRIIKDGVTYLEADVPLLLVDDLAKAQFDDNMFAEMMNMTFNVGDSDWLAAYKQYIDSSGRPAEFRACSAGDMAGGLGSGSAFSDQTFMWTAICVPEPGSLVVLAVGFVGFIGVAKRRMRRH